MKRLLDIHSHRRAPYPEGIISCTADDFNPLEGQRYSVGLHPWYLPPTPDGVEEKAKLLAEVARREDVKAIGEAGFDSVRGGAMMLQSLAFRRQVDLSESFEKPLVIHCVKTTDMVTGWRKQSGARQPWIVHGFRGKPTVATMLLKAGCFLSFGAQYNPLALKMVPPEAYFAETDESQLSIEEIIRLHSEVRQEDMLPIVTANMERLFGEETINNCIL